MGPLNLGPMPAVDASASDAVSAAIADKPTNESRESKDDFMRAIVTPRAGRWEVSKYRRVTAPNSVQEEQRTAALCWDACDSNRRRARRHYHRRDAVPSPICFLRDVQRI